jgi:hypothetical protein
MISPALKLYFLSYFNRVFEAMHGPWQIYSIGA